MAMAIDSILHELHLNVECCITYYRINPEKSFSIYRKYRDIDLPIFFVERQHGKNFIREDGYTWSLYMTLEEYQKIKNLKRRQEFLLRHLRHFSVDKLRTFMLNQGYKSVFEYSRLSSFEPKEKIYFMKVS